MLAKQADRFTETRIDDEIVVMLLDTGDFLSLTGTAVDIWEMIDGSRGRDAIVAELVAAFDAPETAIAADVDGFLARLRETGLLAGE